MTKFHINAKGVPAPCKAKKNCPFGGVSGQDNHYDTIEEAQAAADKQNEEAFGILPKSVKSKKQLNKEYNIIKDELEKMKDPRQGERMRTKLAQLAKEIKGGDKEEMELDNLFANIKSPDGGATISLNNYKVSTPTTGFCASPYPEHSRVFDDAEEINYNVLMDYIDEINEKDNGLLDKEETYLGLWNDPETGKVYLDVSERYHTAEEARVACEKNDQIAYFDLQLFTSVDVDRNAKSGQDLEGEK